MAREVFTLSDATHDTLEPNVKKMMRGWEKSKTHIYDILDETAADPFGPFRSMYRGALRAGVSTAHWDAELEHDRNTLGGRLFHMNEPSVGQVHRELFEAVDAMLEGKSAEEQKREIREAIAVLQDKVAAIDSLLERQQKPLRPVA